MAHLVVTLATEEGTFKFYLILINLNIQVWPVATILDSEGLSFSNKIYLWLETSKRNLRLMFFPKKLEVAKNKTLA